MKFRSFVDDMTLVIDYTLWSSVSLLLVQKNQYDDKDKRLTREPFFVCTKFDNSICRGFIIYPNLHDQSSAARVSVRNALFPPSL